MNREKTTLSTKSDTLKDPVSVYCRLRPDQRKDYDSVPCIEVISPQLLLLRTPVENKGIRKEAQFKFNHIFTGHCTQKEVFDHVAYPLVEDVLNGKNSLLFTYGVTGSGKTYTLTGNQNQPGILPRCIDTIFNSIIDLQTGKFIVKPDRMNGFEVQNESDAMQERLQAIKTPKPYNIKRDKFQMKSNDKPITYINEGCRIQVDESCRYAVFISYVEIYNNTVYDLLDESLGKTLQNKILREDCNKNMYVNNVVEMEVKTAEEAYELFHAGQKRKRMAATALNAESSRSHSIFSVRVVQIKEISQGDQIPDQLVVGQLNLVDLAGSERTNRTQNSGARLKEASSINNSLMTLRTCIEILRENQQNKTNKLVPYRDSRLTLLFKNYFEGVGSVQMIVCVNPSMDDFDENLHVMRFAELTQDVKIIRADTPFKITPALRENKNKRLASSKTPATIKKPKIQQKSNYYNNNNTELLPELPNSLHLNLDDFESTSETLDKFILLLQKRKQVAKSSDLEKKKKEFRKKLVELSQKHIIDITEIRSLKTMMQKEKQRVSNLETKLMDLETVNDSLALKNNELQQVIQSLHHTIDQKDMKINQNILEKEKVKQKFALEAEKMSHELDNKLRRQREHLNAAMRAKDQKILKVKQVIENDDDYSSGNRDENVYKPKRCVATNTNTVVDNSNQRQPRSVTSSTPRKRRSRSVGEVWLEHNSVKPVPLGTVLQPAIKKRKSVTKLSKAEDITNPKQSKYCLITQEPDVDGEMETKVIKGDIVPTCGGGAQVIFNDVEKLRQESPTK